MHYLIVFFLNPITLFLSGDGIIEPEEAKL